MTLNYFILIVVSVSCSAVAQLLLKIGMSRPSVKAVIDGGDKAALALELILNPFVVGGLGLYGLGAVMWLFVLARIDLSMAYPFVAMGFILTMLFGALLGEHLTLSRILGTLLIAGGCVLVAKSA